MAVVVGFRCDVISCRLVRRGVRLGATKAIGSDGVQRMCSWQRGRSDLDPRSIIEGSL